MGIPQATLVSGILVSIALPLWWAATRHRRQPLFIVATAASIAVLVRMVDPRLTVVGITVLSAGLTIAATVAVSNAREQQKRQPLETRVTHALAAAIVVFPLCVIPYTIIGTMIFPGALGSLHHQSYADLAIVCVLASAAGAAHWWFKPMLMRWFAPSDTSPTNNAQFTILVASGLPWLALMASIFVWTAWHAVGTIIALGPPPMGVIQACLWLAALFTLPGFPIAWWIATRIHKTEADPPRA